MSLLLGSDRAHSGISRLRRLLAGTVIAAMIGAVVGGAASWWLSPLKDLDLQEWQIAKSYLLRSKVMVPWGIPLLTDPADLLPPRQSTYQIQAVRRLPAARLDAFTESVWQRRIAPVFESSAWYIGGGAVGAAAVWLLLLYRLASGAKTRDLRRGVELVEPSQLSGLACKKHKAEFLFAGVPVPGDVFYRHALVIGTPGAGKSQCLSSLLDQIRRRGERALVVDDAGEFLSTHGRPQDRDRILNPFDQRSESWNILNEIHNPWDCDSIAQSVIQPDANSCGSINPFFYEGAAKVLSESLKRYHLNGSIPMPEVYEMLDKSTVSQLYKWLEATSAGKFLDPSAKGQSLGVQSTASTKISAWQYIHGAGDFSVRDWVRGGEGWLFLTSREDAAASLTPLLSLWIELAVVELLSRKSNTGERIWIICDELASLQKMPALLKILSKGRKFRSAVVLATQVPSQLESIYGREGAQTLIGTVGNRANFRIEDSDNADAAARFFGEAEIEERKESQNMGARQQGSNLSDDRRTEKLILPSQIQSLPDLECYVKLSGGLPPARSRQKYVKRKLIAEPFEERRFDVSKSDAMEPPAPVPTPTPARTEPSSPAPRVEDDFWGL